MRSPSARRSLERTPIPDSLRARCTASACSSSSLGALLDARLPLRRRAPPRRPALRRRSSDGVIEISADDLKFSAPCMVAPAGEAFIIRFTNNEAVAHNVAYLRATLKGHHRPSRSATIDQPGRTRSIDYDGRGRCRPGILLRLHRAPRRHERRPVRALGGADQLLDDLEHAGRRQRPDHLAHDRPLAVDEVVARQPVEADQR